MIERVKRIETGGGNYFAAPKSDVSFIPSGSKLLDLALGGGWAERHVANVIGDSSTGKTLLCIEAGANFSRKYPRSKIRYREVESAFLPNYAEALGLPLDRVDFGKEQLDTIEDFFEDLEDIYTKARQPELVILDSLDALSDRAEKKRKIGDDSYGTGKPKKLSELFRRCVRDIAKSQVTLIVVSQVRARIGAIIGPKTTRSGGKALDFYAAQKVFLTHLGRIDIQRNKVKRTIGVDILARCDKNKIGLPFREAKFPIKFGYGIDDATSCVEWLSEIGALSREIGVADSEKASYLKGLERMSSQEFSEDMQTIHAAVERRWYEIEKSFLPTRRKYE